MSWAKTSPTPPFLAAIVKVSGVVDAEEFVKDMEASFKHKFASKPQVIEGNMRALKRSIVQKKRVLYEIVVKSAT